MWYHMDISVGRGNLLASRLGTQICLNIEVPKIPFDNRFQNLLLSRLLLVIFKEKNIFIKRRMKYMVPTIYPDVEWTQKSPAEAGFDERKLARAKQWLDQQVGDGRYRVVIVRGGCLVAEWVHGVRSPR